jgi:hypothetical protein
VTAEVRAHADDERPAWSLAIDAFDEIALDIRCPSASTASGRSGARPARA